MNWLLQLDLVFAVFPVGNLVNLAPPLKTVPPSWPNLVPAGGTGMTFGVQQPGGLCVKKTCELFSFFFISLSNEKGVTLAHSRHFINTVLCYYRGVPADDVGRPCIGMIHWLYTIITVLIQHPKSKGLKQYWFLLTKNTLIFFFLPRMDWMEWLVSLHRHLWWWHQEQQPDVYGVDLSNWCTVERGGMWGGSMPW